MSSEADRTPAIIAAGGMRADLLRDGANHGCRVPVSEHLNALVISGHVDLIALARAALSALEKEGWVLVPQKALDWLNGEAPDADGKWFGESQQVVMAGKIHRRYWWRSKFGAMIAASPHQGGKP